jgi:hypothetical protein
MQSQSKLSKNALARSNKLSWCWVALCVALPYAVILILGNSALRHGFKGWQALYIIIPILSVLWVVNTTNHFFIFSYLLKAAVTGYFASSISYLLLALMLQSWPLSGSISQLLFGVFLLPLHLASALSALLGCGLVQFTRSLCR